MFYENNKDFLKSLPLNVRVQTLMQVQKKKTKEKEETKIIKTNKSEKNRKKIYNLYSNLPPWQRHQKLDTIKRLMSHPKCRSVKITNNPARPGSNHREVNYINYK